MGRMKELYMEVEDEFYNALAQGAICESDIALRIRYNRPDLDQVVENLDGLIVDLFDSYLNSEWKED